MKRFALMCAGLGLCMSLSAQHLTPSVISTSGAFFNNASGSLSATAGEMTAIETYISSAHTLTQGFQQPWDFGTAVIDLPETPFEFGVYPNPSEGRVTFLTESEVQADLDLQITDLLGQKIFRETLHHDAYQVVHALDLQHLPAGIYFLTLAIRTDTAVQEQQTIKLEIIR